MAISVVMPALELAQETGKLVAWRKHEGERVTRGEPLLEVETDKAVVEIESPAEGILAGIKAHEGAVIPVGETIAWIVAPGEQPPGEVAPVEPGSRSARESARAIPSAAAPEKRRTAAVRISPKARRIAREHGIDIASLKGSGPEGEILAEDVAALVESKGTSSVGGDEELSSVARLMAERTTHSWTTVPHFFVVREVDAGALGATRERLERAIEEAHGVRPTLTDLLIALVARALLQHPALNSSWTGGTIHFHREIAIGVAVAIKDGVVVPVIDKADKKAVGDIAAQRKDLAERARAGKLRPGDIQGATFTISNMGMHGIDAFCAIINPPQAAILAVGAVAKRVVPVGDQPGIRPMMTLTLSCDHRVVDGARAAAFLNDLADAIRAPEKYLR